MFSVSMKNQWGLYYLLRSSRLFSGDAGLVAQVGTCPLLTLLLLLKAVGGRGAAVRTTGAHTFTDLVSTSWAIPHVRSQHKRFR